MVPVQYGFDNIEGYEAHGGWIASSVQLAKFVTDFDGTRKPRTLKESSVRTMWDRPVGKAGLDPNGTPSAAYYGCGWNVRPVPQTSSGNAWHGGFILGTEAQIVRLSSGVDWTLVLNGSKVGNEPGLAATLDQTINAHIGQIRRWPSSDLFRKYLT
ncbi:MAG: hypothetical protein WCO86_12675 [Planctomycetota bacterium]